MSATAFRLQASALRKQLLVRNCIWQEQSDDVRAHLCAGFKNVLGLGINIEGYSFPQLDKVRCAPTAVAGPRAPCFPSSSRTWKGIRHT